MSVIEFLDLEVDPVDSGALSDDALARALCPKRSELGSTSDPTREAASGGGPGERC